MAEKTKSGDQTSAQPGATQPVAPMPTPGLDTTIPGGAYVVGDKVVDAHGEELKGWTVNKQGNAVPPAVKSAKTAEKPEE